MEVYCRGTARIRHRQSGLVYEIKSDELFWDAVGGDERQMGSEIHYEAALDHPQLGTLSWGIWEYPVGVENYHNTDAGPHELIKDLKYGIDRKEVEVVEWIDYDLPANPYKIFMDSYHETGDLLADYGKDSGRGLVNRLMFSHQVTALEAYLGDRLFTEVANDVDALQRLVELDEDLCKKKFSLAEISKEPGLVERKVREYLREIIYHNLSKVDVLYNIAVGIKILNLATKKGDLFRAVQLRHDCVHRNGFDKAGNELAVFTKTFVGETADVIREFVESIEKALRARSEK